MPVDPHPVQRRARARCRSGGPRSMPLGPLSAGVGSCATAEAGTTSPDASLARQRQHPADGLVDRQLRTNRCTTASAAACSGACGPGAVLGVPAVQIQRHRGEIDRRIGRSTGSRRRRRRSAGAGGGPARRRPRSGRSSASASGTTTVPMSLPSTTIRPDLASARCRSQQEGPHRRVRRHRGDRESDLLAADLGGDVPTAQPVVLPAGLVGESNVKPRQQVCARRRHRSGRSRRPARRA